MEFKDAIQQFAKRVDRLLPQIKTEEATKTSLILPFIRLLGYWDMMFLIRSKCILNLSLTLVLKKEKKLTTLF